jgi:Rrf2 family protein
MDLQLSKRGDYAVRAAIALARASGAEYIKIREVAEQMHIPKQYTAQILGILGSAGIAEAKAGREGGYRLRRPPDQISLLAIVEAAEGPLRSDRCTLRGGPCLWDGPCPVHYAWVEAREALRESLAGASLAAISREDERAALPSPPGAAATIRNRKEEDMALHSLPLQHVEEKEFQS